MSERKAGWYWVMVFEDTWEPAYFDGQYFTLDHGPVAKVGPRCPMPNEAPPVGTRYRSDAGEVVAVVVQVDQLRQLKDSISGDCYMGEDWEKAQIEAMLAALPEPD